MRSGARLHRPGNILESRSLSRTRSGRAQQRSAARHSLGETMMRFAQRDSGYRTYADYLTWPEDARNALVDGVAYSMAPALTIEHQHTVG